MNKSYKTTKPTNQKAGRFVNIDALKNGDELAIQDAAKKLPQLNQRQIDKIWHNIPVEIFEKVVTLANKSVEALQEAGRIAHLAAAESGQRTSDTQKSILQSDVDFAQKAFFAVLADKQDERGQNGINRRHEIELGAQSRVVENVTAAAALAALGGCAYAIVKLLNSK